MSVDIRKRCRTAVKTILAASFNTELAALATDYDISAFTIDFDDQQQFFEGYVTNDSMAISPLMPNPACLAMYTGNGTGSERDKGRVSESVTLHLDFYLLFRLGMETNTEDMPDAIEDVLLQLITPNSVYAYGVIYDGRSFASERAPFVQLGDGYAQRVAFQFQFEVTV